MGEHLRRRVQNRGFRGSSQTVGKDQEIHQNDLRSITRYETLQNHFTTNFGTFDTVLKKTSEADLTRVFGINMVGYFRQ